MLLRTFYGIFLKTYFKTDIFTILCTYKVTLTQKSGFVLVNI